MPSNDYASEAEERRKKRESKAPCVYSAWNEVLHKDTDFYPTVNCSYDCDHCGWNPEVKLRRLEKIKSNLKGGTRNGTHTNHV